VQVPAGLQAGRQATLFPGLLPSGIKTYQKVSSPTWRDTRVDYIPAWVTWRFCPVLPELHCLHTPPACHSWAHTLHWLTYPGLQAEQLGTADLPHRPTADTYPPAHLFYLPLPACPAWNLPGETCRGGSYTCLQGGYPTLPLPDFTLPTTLPCLQTCRRA